MAKEISNSEDILDVRDIIARVEELEEQLEGEEGNTFDAETLARVYVQDDESHMRDEAEEYLKLLAIMEEIKGNGGDEQWRGDWYPVTLIRDSYFEDYAQELVEDCGYIAKDMPSWIEIDWAATARNVRMYYSSVEFEGVTYWYR